MIGLWAKEAVSSSRGICVDNPDKVLVNRCLAGDDSAFSEIIGRYKGKLYNYILRMTSDAEDAEDLTQEVFIRMYSSLDSFRRQSSLNTWLFRIASNICIDAYRRNKKHKAIAYSLDEPIFGDDSSEGSHEAPDISYEPHRVFMRIETAGQIEKALTKLPEKLREVVLLFDVEGIAYEEIAQIVDCPLGTVKSRLFNGRAQLRKLLTDYTAG
jgi:RNA polymerase sigma-70 factor (ECF subfamily)